MILSIGMIVKNEEKYLRRCLEALKPVLEQLDSELIIADTGSTDGTVKIAREFTDKVFDFEWCGDFSAARNSTLSKATGEWFMSLDADEIFENTDDLIRFFLSGEYKSYNTATYIIRNFSDLSRENSAVINSPRLARLTEESRFINAVHECLVPQNMPSKTLSSTVSHYGYIQENNESRLRQKAEMYVEMMLPQLAESPDNCFLYFNISQAYFMAREFDESLRYCDDALKLAKAQNSPLIYSLYAIKAGIFHATGKLAEARSTINDYFASAHNTIGTDLEMYHLQAECMYHSASPTSAILSFEAYIKLYSEYSDGQHRTIDTVHHALNFTDNESLMSAVHTLIELYFGKYSFKTAIEKTLSIYSIVSVRASSVDAPILEFIKMSEAKDYSHLPELLKQSDDKHMELFQSMIEGAMKEPEFRAPLLEQFSGCTSEDSDYLKLLKLRCDFYRGSLTATAVDEFLKGLPEWKPLYADAVFLAVCTYNPIKVISSNIDAFDLEKEVFKSPFLHLSDFSDAVCRYAAYFPAIAVNSDVNECLTAAFLFRQAFIKESLEDSEKLISLFYSYTKTFGCYLSGIFLQEILSEERARCIPMPLRAGFYCCLAAEAKEKGDTPQFLSHLKTAACLDTELKAGLEALISMDSDLNH